MIRVKVKESDLSLHIFLQAWMQIIKLAKQNPQTLPQNTLHHVKRMCKTMNNFCF